MKAKIIDFVLKTFFFWSSPLNLWARIEICTIRFCRTRQTIKRSLPYKQELCSERLILWDEDLFFCFCSWIWGKTSSVPPKYFFAPLVTLFWCWACTYDIIQWRHQNPSIYSIHNYKRKSCIQWIQLLKLLFSSVCWWNSSKFWYWYVFLNWLYGPCLSFVNFCWHFHNYKHILK